MITLALIVGLWTTTCIQTQISGTQGYVVESYEFSQNGEFVFAREWYTDAACSDSMGMETEKGEVTLGQQITGMFISGKTVEADFKTQSGTDLGAIALKNAQSLKVARGMKGSQFRNTMTGIFEYRKQ